MDQLAPFVLERPAPLTNMSAVTLGDVIDFVAADPDMKPGERQDRLCALRRLAQVLGKDPRLISAAPEAMRVMLKSVLPATHGLKPARWGNIRSRVLSAFVQAGIPVMRGRSSTRLSSSWLEFQLALPSEETRRGLGRFMRFCTDKGIEPEAVTDAVFDRYCLALKTESLTDRWYDRHRTACKLWNKVAAAHSSRPLWRVAVPHDMRRYSLAWSDFPSSFQADVAAFLARSSTSSGPFTDEYVRPQRPKTIELRRQQIRQMASLLVHSGHPIAGLTDLAVLADPARARTILEAVHKRVGDRSQQLHGMALLLKVIAQHWVKAQPAVVSKLARYASQVAPKAAGMTVKNRRRLRQFESSQNLQLLLLLPQRVFAELKRIPYPDRRAALRAHYALAIQVLVAAPMRLANLTALDLSRHIVQVGRGTRSVLHIVIPGDETKTGEPYEVPVPAETAALLAAYRKRYLPLISAEPTPMLFPNLSGRRRDETAFSTALGAFVKRETGLVINPHLFRHLAVTLYLQQAPDDVETARRLLGHKSVVTTLSFYADIKNDAAFRRYDDVIANLRSDPLAGRRARKTKRLGG